MSGSGAERVCEAEEPGCVFGGYTGKNREDNGRR